MPDASKMALLIAGAITVVVGSPAPLIPIDARYAVRIVSDLLFDGPPERSKEVEIEMAGRLVARHSSAIGLPKQMPYAGGVRPVLPCAPDVAAIRVVTASMFSNLAVG